MFFSTKSVLRLAYLQGVASEKKGVTLPQHASSGWNQGAEVGPLQAANCTPRFSLKGSSPGGILSAWDRGARREQVCRVQFVHAVCPYSKKRGVRWRSKHSSSSCLRSKMRECSPPLERA